MDPTYLLFIPAILLSAFAQWKINSTYNKYAQINSAKGWRAADAAAQIMRNNGIGNVKLERIQGTLTDHFDPKAMAVRLSNGVANSASIAALGVSAHEIGHVMQHQEQYMPIKIRNALVPVANFGSQASWVLLLLGLAMQTQWLVTLGVFVFLGAVLFQLVTLPVELNASNRAMKALESGGYLTAEELPGARKVLNAAALTYVAALATSMLQLLRMFMMSRRGNNN